MAAPAGRTPTCSESDGLNLDCEWKQAAGCSVVRRSHHVGLTGDTFSWKEVSTQLSCMGDLAESTWSTGVELAASCRVSSVASALAGAEATASPRVIGHRDGQRAFPGCDRAFSIDVETERGRAHLRGHQLGMSVSWSARPGLSLRARVRRGRRHTPRWTLTARAPLRWAPRWIPGASIDVRRHGRGGAEAPADATGDPTGRSTRG